jgi:hypothetical protein
VNPLNAARNLGQAFEPDVGLESPTYDMPNSAVSLKRGLDAGAFYEFLFI